MTVTTPIYCERWNHPSGLTNSKTLDRSINASQVYPKQIKCFGCSWAVHVLLSDQYTIHLNTDLSGYALQQVQVKLCWLGPCHRKWKRKISLTHIYKKTTIKIAAVNLCYVHVLHAGLLSIPKSILTNVPNPHVWN